MVVVVVWVWSGCGRETPPAPPPPGASAPEASETPANGGMQVTGEGFEIVFHAEGFTDTEYQQPLLVIQAGTVNLNDSGEYYLEDVNATVYQEGQPSTEMVAGKGEVNESEGIARLSGGVTVTAGDMVLVLESIEWQNKATPPQAVSGDEVRLRKGVSDLKATGLVLIPSEQSLMLNRVTGHWSSKGTNP